MGCSQSSCERRRHHNTNGRAISGPGCGQDWAILAHRNPDHTRFGEKPLFGWCIHAYIGFSLASLVRKLSQAIVFLKLAVKIVDFIALNILSRRYLYRAAKYSWTADYEEEDGKDEMDYRAEDHISGKNSEWNWRSFANLNPMFLYFAVEPCKVTRRDMRAAFDNLIILLADKGISLPLQSSREQRLHRKPSVIPKRKFCGGCKALISRPKKTGKKPLRPNLRLLKWDEIVAGSGTSEYGMFDGKTAIMLQPHI